MHPLEPLESRIAPAVLILNNHTATFTDVDGDRVTITVSKGDLNLPNIFTSAAAGVGEQLQRVELMDQGFAGANLSITVAPRPGGDGLVNVGAIESLLDLGAVRVQGDLGRITAGDAVGATQGLKSLTVHSMGRVGVDSQPPDSATFTRSLESFVTGRLGALTVAGDISGASVSALSMGPVKIGGSLIGGVEDYSGVLSADGIDSVSIGGDLRGGRGEGSGQITPGRHAGPITLGGSMLGGSGADSGRIVSDGDLVSVRIGGDFKGGSGNRAGWIEADDIGPVTIAGSLLGGLGATSGNITAVSTLGFVKIGGNVVGGAGEHSGEILSGGTLAGVSLGGSLVGGTANFAGQIRSTGRMGPVTIAHDIRGGDNAGTLDAGIIFTDATLDALAVGGSLVGGAALESGFVYANLGLGPVKIGHDVLGGAGANSGSIYSNLRIAGIAIGGSLVGGSNDDSGKLQAGSLGPVSIGKDVRGGSDFFTGYIGAATGKLDGLTIGGSLIGGTGAAAGQVFSEGDMGAVKIGGDVLGGITASNGTGVIQCRGNLASLSIGGSLAGGPAPYSGGIDVVGNAGPIRIGADLIGGSITGADSLADSGFIRAGGNLKSVTIGGSILAGIDGSTGTLGNSGSIRSGHRIDSISIAGNVLGNVGAAGDSRVVISAAGRIGTPADLSEVAIGRLSIGGSTQWLNVLAGYDTGLTPANADAQIGSVSVGGDWMASNLVASAMNLGTDNDIGGTGTDADNVNFGDLHDILIGEITDNPNAVARIGSITIGGRACGSPESQRPTDNFGFVAEEIGALKVGARTFTLAAGVNNDGFPVNWHLGGVLDDIHLHETATPQIDFNFVAGPVATLVNASTITYSDADNDFVTVKLSKPLLTAGNVNDVFKFNTGNVGASTFPQQLQLIDLKQLATNGLSVTITVARRPSGDGLAHIGSIDSTGYDLGTVVVPGDLGRIRAGDAVLTTPGLGTLAVRSMGLLGTDTQAAGGDSLSNIVGDLGTLRIAGNVDRISFGGSQKIGTASVGGSVLDAIIQNNTGFGTVKIGGDLRGGTIASDGRISSITVGGSLVGGDGPSEGRIGAVGLGAVKIGHNLVGGSRDTTATIFSGATLDSLTIGGSILTYLGAGNVGSDGAMGAVKIGRNLLGGSPSETGGITSGGTLASVTLGGSLVGATRAETGFIVSNGAMGPVVIGGNVFGGAGQNSGDILSGSDIGPVTIGGSLIGGSGMESGRIFTAGGGIGAVTIGHDVRGGTGYASGRIEATGRISSFTVGGSVLGGAGEFSGALYAGAAGLGAVRIGHDLIGGTESTTGFVGTDGALAGVRLGGSLIGGHGANEFGSGAISASKTLGAVTVGGDVIGGAARDSGVIRSGERAASIVIGRSLVGGSVASGSADVTGAIIASGGLGVVKIGRNVLGGDLAGTATGLARSGFIETAADLDSLTIGGSLIAGRDSTATGDIARSATIRTGDDIAALTIVGSVVGTVGAQGNAFAVISARGQDTPGATTDVAIGRLSIGGHVENAQILAGYGRGLDPVNADAQIGPVTVGGAWIGSSLVAGAQAAAFPNFGLATDAKISGGGTTDLPAITSRIASIVIRGPVFGTPSAVSATDHFGFVAEHIGSFRSAAFTAALTPNQDVIELARLTADVTIREVA